MLPSLKESLIPFELLPQLQWGMIWRWAFFSDGIIETKDELEEEMDTDASMSLDRGPVDPRKGALDRRTPIEHRNSHKKGRIDGENHM